MSLHVSARRVGSVLPSTTFICSQCRHATLLRRPKRPYTFTQLITLSDGSTFTHRTTSPQPVYRPTRDTRNAPLWNPSSHKLVNVEEDEAGLLAAFRNKYGRSWDAKNTISADELNSSEAAEAEGQKGGDEAAATSAADKAASAAAAEAEAEAEDENLLDLISSFGQDVEDLPPSRHDAKPKAKK